MERIVRQGQLYRHFKNKIYQIIAIAIHSETKEKMVVYQAMYGDFNIYVRPYDMFVSEVDTIKYPNAGQKYRFELIGETGNSDMPIKEEKENELHTDRIYENKFMEDESHTDKLQKEELQTKEYQDEVIISEDDYEDEGEVSPILLEFLNLDTYEEKLDMFINIKDKLDEKLLGDIAVALDIGFTDNMSEKEQFDSIKFSLQTFAHFEDNRKRN